MTATKVIGESVKQTNRTFIKSYVNDYAKMQLLRIIEDTILIH